MSLTIMDFLSVKVSMTVWSLLRAFSKKESNKLRTVVARFKTKI